MKNAQVNVAPIACKFFDLMAFTANSDVSETIIGQDEPFDLCVTVEFSRSGAIALMPLALSIQIDFFAKPYGLGDTLELGSVTAETAAGKFTYSLTLQISEGPQKLGIISEQIYNVSALLKVGAPAGPALITGFVDDLTIQTYSR